jgi:hypothetical protein
MATSNDAVGVVLKAPMPMPMPMHAVFYNLVSSFTHAFFFILGHPIRAA